MLSHKHTWVACLNKIHVWETLLSLEKVVRGH